jgi:AcrR family transcriptional regulator
VSPRAGLDRAAVVRAAAALADADGPVAVSLARVADELGVRTPSLYNHVTGLDGLRRELALLGLRELRADLERAVAGMRGDAAIIALADAYRAFAHRRPGLYAATLRAAAANDRELTDAGAKLVELVLSVLTGSGLQDDDALHAVRAFRSVAHGFVALEAAGGFALALDRDESYRRLVRVFIDGLQRAEREKR